MSRFLIYLFESGLCLTLFYIGYILFFRKETYFTFNRIYLVTSMVIALLLPLSNVQLSLDSGEKIGNALATIGEFRNYYEELILMTEPDFMVGNELPAVAEGKPIEQSLNINSEPEHSSFSLSSLLLYIYISGVLFFTFRLLLLVYNLYRIIRKNNVIHSEGYNIVLIKDDMPSFSFINWIFVNKEALQPEEFEQVITHEKVHVQHKHSVDLLLAHIITIFQWFNPLTWRIQKSIKTCHEYIADRQVIDQGHELFDYQSLLLSQLISIRSVELVNNFNLLSIKKRIAMMNKIKSGNSAKLKALLVIPMVIFAFFFFANMTGKTLIAENNTEAMKVNLIPVQESAPTQVVKESHENLNELNEGKSLEVESDVVDAPKTENLLFIEGHYEINLLDNEENNDLAKEQEPVVNLPVAKSVKVYDEAYVLSRIKLSGKQLYVDGKKVNLDNCNSIMQGISKKPQYNTKSILLEIDAATSMSEVDKVKNALRLNDLLKIAYAANADKSAGVNNGSTAILNLLPPKDAKMLSKEEAFFEGIKLFTISPSSSADLKNTGKRLRDYILDSKKYVILYEYSDKTSYNDYIKTLDMVYSTVWNLRKDQAFSKGIDYDNMTKEQEKKLRKKYPLTLTMKNVDSDN
ncbi:MAG: M56 family metallopeptidase [Bacteroidales bacterium]|nr:M56 family metallopeptidase [Bacteroidales bacterium]